MESEIIVALIIGISSIVTSIIWGWIPRTRKQRIDNIKETNRTLYRDIRSFYDIESLLLDELSNKSGINKETLKKKYRKIIEDKNGYTLSPNIKPSQTKNKI